jgi:hypothetical protein
MRRGLIALLTIVPLTVGAQVQLGPDESPKLTARVSADEVVARMMSFDRNSDGRVQQGELAERMQPLLARGDANGDGALDRTEIRSLASTPQAPIVVHGVGGPGHYSFADEVGQTSRMHIEGAIDDLRLTAATKERALAAARTYMDTLEITAAGDLMAELSPQLTSEQLAEVKTLVEGQAQGKHGIRMVLPKKELAGGSEAGRTAVLTVEGREVVANIAEPDGSVQIVKFFAAATHMNLAARVEHYNLAPAQKRQALDAVERYNARLKLRDVERSELMAAMRDMLNDEERDNLRAALERRPLVASGSRNVFFGSHAVFSQGGDHRLVIDVDQKVR